MKFLRNFAIFFVTALAVLSTSLFVKTGNFKGAVVSDNQHVFKTDDELVKDALQKMKELVGRSGKPYQIIRSYSFKNNKAISVETKIHYSDYRKKPVSIQETFQKCSDSPDCVIQVIYKPHDKKYVSLVAKKGKKSIKDKRMKIPSSLYI